MVRRNWGLVRLPCERLFILVLALSLTSMAAEARIQTPTTHTGGMLIGSANPERIDSARRNFSQREIRSFVIAVMQIHRIIKSAKEQRIQPDPAIVDKRIRDVIKVTPGIDVRIYFEIVNSIETNQSLRSQIRDMIRNLQKERKEALQDDIDI